MTESTKPISALRQRMIEDMILRKLSCGTQRGYVRAVKQFAHYFGRSPAMADAEDLFSLIWQKKAPRVRT